MVLGGAGVELEDAGEVGDCLDAAEGEDDADELDPDGAEALVAGLEIAGGEMGDADGDEQDDDDDRGDGEDDGQRAAMLGAEPIDPAHEEQDGNGGVGDGRLMRGEKGDIEIAEGGPAAEGGGYREIRDEEEGADNREEPALHAGGRVDAAAIGEIAADDGVIDADEAGEGANGEDEGQAGEAGCEECKAGDVGLARAPVPVEEACGAGPADVARTMLAKP